MPKKLKYAILALLPAMMLYIAWPPRDLYILAFIAFVPWLILERESRGERSFIWWLYLGLVLFNIMNTWWVWYASAPGSIVMILANAFLMSIPFNLYRRAIPTIGENKALFALVCYWLGFEYLHLNWEVTWPWLSLGNVFAKHTDLIQWYEFTGMLGGSLWVLLINVLIYKWLTQKNSKFSLQAAIIILIPLIISILLLNSNRTKEAKEKFDVLIVQPNIDPYQKFNAGMEVSSLQAMLQQIESELTDSIDVVILPETALVEYIDEDNFSNSQSIRLIKEFLVSHPHLRFITGASTYNFYEPDEPRSPTARLTTAGYEYESYNTAMEITTSGVKSLHHKSKLVPGVEKMPYPKILGFLEYLSIDMGGVSGSLGSDNEAVVFKMGNANGLAPMICYESVFPDYVRQYVQQGAEIILVMTNDGWWRNTDGYKQHMYYACLRAIENRREVLRSANTGISCHIDPYGRIKQRTEWWVPDVLMVNAASYDHKTFYTEHGDYIGRFGSFFSILLILGVVVKKKVKYRA